MQPVFAEAADEIPPEHVAVGFSTYDYKPGAKKNTIGVCHATGMAMDGVNEKHH